ncbi:hypothetical protein [Rhodopseudomonas pseudopalustris]|uniref:Uncharacterized protein n=1 Tax=Rhodopseudomonas pseudopalustris TaxID=1513892 RepID=A0A1H8V9X5_9BRAD|nr:hypothetical protein [Rhodopseudomonas pseudopalustris]SEP12219.1 hypothetical protein SAMN05444123_108150 [Rhodopseudomonas pseudopalustris]
MTGRRLRISDHALLRILRHAGGVDVETLRAAVAMALARSVERAELIGEKDFVIVSDGLRYVVSGNTLVTVTEAPKR